MHWPFSNLSLCMHWPFGNLSLAGPNQFRHPTSVNFVVEEDPKSMFGVKTGLKRLISGRSLIIDRAYQNVTFLSGSHRSGTTWIEELINYKNDYVLVYEPFLPFYFSGKLQFPESLYIRPSCRD